MRSLLLYSFIFFYILTPTIVESSSLISSQDKLLKCSFGFMGAPIFVTESQLLENDTIGLYTRAAFQGAPPKTIQNLVFIAEAPLIYFFQLDEGFDNNNISISVSSKRNEIGEFLAVVENPQSPQLRKLNGSCGVN